MTTVDVGDDAFHAQVTRTVETLLHDRRMTRLQLAQAADISWDTFKTKMSGKDGRPPKGGVWNGKEIRSMAVVLRAPADWFYFGVPLPLCAARDSNSQPAGRRSKRGDLAKVA